MQPVRVDIGLAVERAVAHQRAGQFAQAEQLCRAILRAQPDDPTTLHVLGVCLLQRGDYAGAARALTACLKTEPHQAAALTNLGIALQGLKRLDDALHCYRKSLALDSNQVATLNMQGLVLLELMRFAEALASFDRAVQMTPGFAEGWCGRANAMTQLRRYEEAIESLDRAEALRPNYGEALSNRSIVLNLLRRHDEALAAAQKAVALLPDWAVIHRNIGDALVGLGRGEQALVSYNRALELDPNNIHIIGARAALLTGMHRQAEASDDYIRALALINAREKALLESNAHRLQQPDLRRRLAELSYQRGQLLGDLRRYGEAAEAFAKAAAWQPDHAEAHVSESHSRLRLGDFENGWRKYEWRRHKPDIGSRLIRNFPQPQWIGEQDPSCRRILLHAEQGFGDAIQFCRYAPLLVDRGARVFVLVQPAMKTLLLSQRQVEVIAAGEPVPDFDLHSPLMSLPFAFGTTLESVPANVPYLHADLAQVGRWRQRLDPMSTHDAGTPRVGVVWSGNPRHGNDRVRSVPLATFATIFKCRAQFISLNPEVGEVDRESIAGLPILPLGEELADFADTAALIENLDLVISVDTAVAHLAGALGKPVWILLGEPADFRWLLNRDDSPWYPTARLFRQYTRGDWPEVIGRVASELRAFIAARLNAAPAT